jgi:adenylate cyclase
VPRKFSADDLAQEATVSRDRIEWLTSIGVLKPAEPDTFRFPDIFRVKLVAALLDGGFTTEQIEWAVAEGHLNLDVVDEYLLLEPGPRSERTFAEFQSTAGPRASLLPSIYWALGLPEPDPASRLTTDEEDRLRRFLDGWSLARSDETLIRAARLIAEGTRMVSAGWADLLDEDVAGPARERLYRGEVERFPGAVRAAFSTLFRLQPEMMHWLMQRYQEQRSVAGIVQGFEQFFAARAMRPPPEPSAPPAVVFVDLAGFTRATEEHGDEMAVRFASTLQRHAEAVASQHDGRLVKLLGDGAMLTFPDATRGLDAAVHLVRVLGTEGGLSAHAGIHSGPVVRRDLDLFGRTVNLASRLAEAAGPGEVWMTEAVAEAVDTPPVRLEPADGASLKGITEEGSLFRARVVDR